MECKSLRESGKELKKFNIAYFGASCDPASKNKQFADKLELDYPLLSDTDAKVAKAYGIFNGRFSSRSTIFVDVEGKVAHIESKVNVRDHGNQIVKQLKALKFPLRAGQANASSAKAAELEAFKAKLVEPENLARMFDMVDADQNGSVEQKELDAFFKRISELTQSKKEAPEDSASDTPDLTGIKCLFMPETDADKKFFRAFKGEKVYFCCWKCPGKFDPENPEHIAAAEKQIALIKSRK